MVRSFRTAQCDKGRYVELHLQRQRGFLILLIFRIIISYLSCDRGSVRLLELLGICAMGHFLHPVVLTDCSCTFSFHLLLTCWINEFSLSTSFRFDIRFMAIRMMGGSFSNNLVCLVHGIIITIVIVSFVGG